MLTIQEALRELNKNEIKSTQELNEELVRFEDLTEDLQSFSSLPSQLLPVETVKNYILNIPAADPSRPPKFFKLGYMKELINEIPSKFRGGRGSEGNPKVRVIKCTEYSKLYTGVDWRSTDETKKADAVLGTARHTGDRTGFNFQGDDALANRIGVYPNGREALQAYIADDSRQKTKYFISIDDGDLVEISKDDLKQYLTPSEAAKLDSPSVRKAVGKDAEGNDLFDKRINRFILDGIYMIGDLGHSVM